MHEVELATMAADINYIKELMGKLEALVDKHTSNEVLQREKLESRIKALENWKIAFVAKFSVYSAAALFLGSIVSQLLIWFITK